MDRRFRNEKSRRSRGPIDHIHYDLENTIKILKDIENFNLKDKTRRRARVTPYRRVSRMFLHTHRRPLGDLASHGFDV